VNVARSHQYRTGLIYYDPDFACRGYTLFCGGHPACAWLIDMQGRICKRWQASRGIAYAQLLPDGHLLCRAAPSREVQGLRGLNGQSPGVFELDWDGRVVWEFDDEWLHHDQHRLPNGHTLLIAWRWISKTRSRRVPGGISKADDPPRMLADVILEVDGDARVVREWRSWEHLDVAEDIICPLDHRLEWTHANSITTTPDGDWLVSFRRTHTVAAIDPESGRFRWKWGRGTVNHQHDAQILHNGHLLVFDNGVHRFGEPDYSRVLEVDRETGQIVWSYADEPPFHFYSVMAGSAERLRNGNTLICHSSVGRFFEVTHDKQIVWEYVNPFYVKNPRLGGWINIVFRVHRHLADDPALAGRDLDPARYANLNRLYAP
jgi:hypothetical protein